VNPRDYYDAMYAEHRPRPATGLPGFFARLTLDREEAVLRLVSDGGRLLDVGCGEGWLVLAAASRFSEAYGIDISGVRIGRAQARVQESDSSRIRLQVVDVSEGLPFDDGYFDAVSCVATLEHVFSPVAVAREMWRVLRPGGEIVIAASNAAYAVSRVRALSGKPPRGSSASDLLDGGVLHHFTTSSLVAVLRDSGFRVVEKGSFGQLWLLRNWWKSLLASGLVVKAVKGTATEAA